jgi:hypothetical protein
MESVRVTDLLEAATEDGEGAVWQGTWNANRRARVQGVVTGTGAVTATIAVQGSNDGVHWELIGTLTLTADDADSDSLGIDYPWYALRADLTNLTGVDAKASALLSM